MHRVPEWRMPTGGRMNTRPGCWTALFVTLGIALVAFILIWS